jgi:hypothetical protein
LFSQPIRNLPLPHPFNPATVIPIEIPEAMSDNVAVCDHPGRKTAVLADRVMSAGHHAVVWDGRDNAGKQAAAGVFLHGAGRLVDENR